jgi:hypothetical protein
MIASGIPNEQNRSTPQFKKIINRTYAGVVHAENLLENLFLLMDHQHKMAATTQSIPSGEDGSTNDHASKVLLYNSWLEMDKIRDTLQTIKGLAFYYLRTGQSGTYGNNGVKIKKTTKKKHKRNKMEKPPRTPFITNSLPSPCESMDGGSQLFYCLYEHLVDVFGLPLPGLSKKWYIRFADGIVARIYHAGLKEENMWFTRTNRGYEVTVSKRLDAWLGTLLVRT